MKRLILNLIIELKNKGFSSDFINELSWVEAQKTEHRDMYCPVCGFKVAVIPKNQTTVQYVFCRKCKFTGPLSPLPSAVRSQINCNGQFCLFTKDLISAALLLRDFCFKPAHVCLRTVLGVRFPAFAWERTSI